MPVRRPSLLLLLVPLLAGCVDHYLGYPRTPPARVDHAVESMERGALRVRLEWARPRLGGRAPAVIVHPEAGHEAREMRGVLFDLASRGWVAVAADYRRTDRRGTLFAWRERSDPLALWDRVASDPGVDPARIALLGFSQGGVYSLVIAAESQRAAAVVAYYPVTDFAAWLDEPGRSAGARWVFRRIRGHFYRQSGARSEEEFATFLARASPLRHAERIRAPVLLVHGTRDRSASIVESRRLAARLRGLGRSVELLEVDGAGHVFNFRDEAKAAAAWAATVGFLERHLRSSAAPAT
jgi:dipeptidyl aminopeptidase/acylaminoacyl peptidase